MENIEFNFKELLKDIATNYNLVVEHIQKNIEVSEEHGINVIIEFPELLRLDDKLAAIHNNLALLLAMNHPNTNTPVFSDNELPKLLEFEI